MLAGERGPHGRTRARRDSGSSAAARPCPIYLAALMPPMLGFSQDRRRRHPELHARLAVPRMSSSCARGARRRDASQLEIVSQFQTIVTTTSPPRAGRHADGAVILPRSTPVVALRSRTGKIRPAGAKGRARNLAAVSDEMIDRLAIIGPASHCRERLEAFVRAGVTTPMVHPFLFDEASIWSAFDALAPG
jgi:hypothetical protein